MLYATRAHTYTHGTITKEEGKEKENRMWKEERFCDQEFRPAYGSWFVYKADFPILIPIPQSNQSNIIKMYSCTLYPVLCTLYSTLNTVDSRFQTLHRKNKKAPKKNEQKEKSSYVVFFVIHCILYIVHTTHKISSAEYLEQMALLQL